MLTIPVAVWLAAGQAAGAVQGSVAAWGDDSSGQSTVPAEALTGVVGIAAGDAHSLALKEDGTVAAWGSNLSGQSTVPTDLGGVIAIAAGGYHNLALKADGTVVAWGYSSQGQSTVPAGLRGVVAIAAGGFHSLALKADGRVMAWGYDHWGQSTVPTNLSGVVAIAAGYYYSLALKSDGTVVGWGRNVAGEGTSPANLVGVVGIAAGSFHNLALKEDGTVVGWGRNLYGESTVPPGLSDVLAIAAGSFHSLALKSDGTLAGWGNNDYGQSTVPEAVSGAIVIAAGAYHNLAGLSDRAPLLFRQPTNQTAAVGTSVVFAVGAGGTRPLHYQWRKDGVSLGQETNSSLTLRSVQVSDMGSYDVVVTNPAGSVTSQVARLTIGYSLAVQVSGAGTVFVTPNNQIFEPGSVVSLTASAAVNNQFISWSGDARGNLNPLTLTMDTNKTVTATFRPGYRITVAADGPGSVTMTPLKQSYFQGDVVQMAATPARWHHFSRWNDGVITNPRSVTVTSDATFTAVFILTSPLEKLEFGGVSRVAPVGIPAVFVDGVFAVEPAIRTRGSATISLLTTFSHGTLLFTSDGSDPDFSASLYVNAFVLTKSATLRAIAYNADFTQSVESDPLEILIQPTLNASVEGGGTVTVDPPAGAYFSNDLAVVTATSAPGWTFLHWLGDETGTNPVASVSMNRNKCVQAVFGTALGTTVVGSGSVVRSPTAELYPFGTPSRLTAVPQEGNYFALWGNAATGTNNPLMFAVTNPNPTVTAVFAALPANQHALTVLPDGFGTVTNSPRGNRFGNGTNVTLRALPEPGRDFLGWSGDASGTNNPLVVTMTQSRVITANFTKRPRLAPLLCDGAPNGEEFQLLLTGEFGGRYSIEATTGLAPAAPAWEPLATLTNTFGSAQFNDSFPTNRAQRFYRAIGP